MIQTVAKSAPVKKVPERSEVNLKDTWDLSPLYAKEADWEKGLEELREQKGRMWKWKGKLHRGEDLTAALEEERQIDLMAERLGQYAHLRVAEDGGDGAARDRALRLEHLTTQLAEETAWFMPELMQIGDAEWAVLVKHPCLAEWQGKLERIRRYRPHVLGEGEERLMALAGPALGGPDEIFSQLTNVDFRFGTVRDEDGSEIELSHGTFASLLQRQSAEVRRTAWKQYYTEFEQHAFSLAATLASSVKGDVFRAKARKYPSARAQSLFPDRVPEKVYDNLVATVRKNLKPLQRYHRLRRKVLGLKELKSADLQVPLVAAAKRKTKYEEAADLVTMACRPLGGEYQKVLGEGLGRARWVDRYENRGKRSGAFSSGSYQNPPYILMNYREDVLSDVYTLAHEAGHSMHTWMSHRAQPYQDAHYPILLAEVASTFNEELLTHHLLEGPAREDKTLRAYILNRQIDDIRGTLYRQVMFAEFERRIHEAEETGVALTLDFFRICYRELLEAYLGEAMEIEAPLELECLRIPHFYSAFYVYKYAIGISAAMALSDKVLAGDGHAVQRVHGFLKSGGSRPPLETLRAAGVDMESPEPVEAALALFERRVEELEKVLG
ncbi:MAG: oligoendopeptidase F [Verrucomicrobia bacterium]|nr:oligoendopeptidase F [Verrucomicrobiota bacterium]